MDLFVSPFEDFKDPSPALSLCSRSTSPTRGEVECTLVFITSPLVGEVGSERSAETGEGLKKLKC
jgi:hypothetical protein